MERDEQTGLILCQAELSSELSPLADSTVSQVFLRIGSDMPAVHVSQEPDVRLYVKTQHILGLIQYSWCTSCSS